MGEERRERERREGERRGEAGGEAGGEDASTSRRVCGTVVTDTALSDYLCVFNSFVGVNEQSRGLTELR